MGPEHRLVLSSVPLAGGKVSKLWASKEIGTAGRTAFDDLYAYCSVRYRDDKEARISRVPLDGAAPTSISVTYRACTRREKSPRRCSSPRQFQRCNRLPEGGRTGLRRIISPLIAPPTGRNEVRRVRDSRR
jgi:hypothetical protein